GNFELFYVRDKEKREVDFLIVRDKKPWLLAECKESDTKLSPSLKYYSSLLKPDMTCQIVKQAGIHEIIQNKDGTDIFVISAGKILSLLP
ncbi:MAG TPA: ATPase, partial [Deltaproteobacteria bacterium]|nr:ATPase [Deltaproteobacteria bacterium]